MKYSLAVLATATTVLAGYAADPVRRSLKRSNHLTHEVVPPVHEMVDPALVLDPHGLALSHGMAGAGITVTDHTEIVIIWANPGGAAPTTTINEKVTVTETVTAGAGHEASLAPKEPVSHTVVVGGPAGLIFAPDSLHNIPVGDTVIFEFLAENHTVTQSPFDTPCIALDGGMDSGFQSNPENSVQPAPQVAMQVMTTEPLWFYCKQGTHCGAGMVFSINPTAEKSQAMFQELAIAQNGTETEVPPIADEDAPPAEAPITPPPANDTVVVTPPDVKPGVGEIGADGQCHCFVQCATTAFPNVDLQGRGAIGGFSGSMPLALMGSA